MRKLALISVILILFISKIYARQLDLDKAIILHLSNRYLKSYSLSLKNLSFLTISKDYIIFTFYNINTNYNLLVFNTKTKKIEYTFTLKGLSAINNLSLYKDNLYLITNYAKDFYTFNIKERKLKHLYSIGEFKNLRILPPVLINKNNTIIFNTKQKFYYLFKIQSQELKDVKKLFSLKDARDISNIILSDSFLYTLNKSKDKLLIISLKDLKRLTFNINNFINYTYNKQLLINTKEKLIKVKGKQLTYINKIHNADKFFVYKDYIIYGYNNSLIAYNTKTHYKFKLKTKYLKQNSTLFIKLNYLYITDRDDIFIYDLDKVIK